MSNYNPIPPRVWSRVENQCVFIEQGSTYEEAFIPLTGQIVSQAQADYETKQIYKGNILQYKGNSARFTKSQRYSQLARLTGPNRKKVFATQSQTYTNPNTTGLLRVGFSTFTFPNQIVGAPNNISGPFAYGIPDPNDCSTNSIQDGGTLVCGTLANPCTGEIIKQPPRTATVCNPSSASNVPGASILCWNNRVQTWFPRQRYFMNNSANKWPTNYKGFVSASTPIPPILTVDISGAIIKLSWQQPKSCYPITSYVIFVNNVLYDSVLANVNTYNFVLNPGDYKIYIRALSDSLPSNPSNIVDITISSEIIIISYNNIKRTIYSNSGNTVVVIESTIQPSYGQSSVSNGEFYINGGFPVNILLVGGGGGGASGYAGTSGGGGGGSAAINYITNFTFPSLIPITFTIGVGGGGRTPGNQGGGKSSGQNGQNTSLYFGSTQLIAYAGNGGLGFGTASGYAGGPGGAAVKISEPVGPTYSGYGGSSAGGAWYNGGSTVNNPGPIGSGYTSNGLSGSFGSSSTSTSSRIGGNGANNVFPNIILPIIGTIYFGGSGGGGGYYGGNAGNNGLGGLGGQSNSGLNNGTNAVTYGAGGGGGGATPTSSNTGGNGANGTMIIWW